MDWRFWIILPLAGFTLGWIIRWLYARFQLTASEQNAERIKQDAIKEAEAKKKEILLEAKDLVIRERNQQERETRERKAELQRYERRVFQKEESIDKKIAQIEKTEQILGEKEKSFQEREESLDKEEERYRAELERISGLSTEEAKALIIQDLENEAKHDAQSLINKIEQEANLAGEKKARDVLVATIQRLATEVTGEVTVATVTLPNDEMKGRIIGREGRNIRAIETLTGVDLIIDDTPEAVILSGFDPIKREIARISLEKLIVDGRIHPARIEEMVEKAEKEVTNIIKEEGEHACFEIGVHNLHPELVKLLGRLKYRTSYGQNVLKHSIEVAQLAGLMAGELGLDTKVAKRAGLLHDIGKALDHEIEGTHVDIGIDVLRKYRESDLIINGMSAHHGDYEPKSLEAILIAAADALSAARPGARRETLETYIKRLQKLEEIANTTRGVEHSYAIQAGREIRIIAKPDEIGDDEIAYLAREISQKIESELEYPGQIKVNVIRETRAIDYAK